MLAASQGTKLTLSCDGEDEAKAINAIEALIDDKFGESEQSQRLSEAMFFYHREHRVHRDFNAGNGATDRNLERSCC